jgi:hypothetical protein
VGEGLASCVGAIINISGEHESRPRNNANMREGHRGDIYDSETLEGLDQT